jgi:Helix-turn-helix domain
VDDSHQVSHAVTAGIFGAHLREWRKDAGLSLSQLSSKTFYSKSHLSKIENGRKAANAELARRCDVILGAGGQLAGLVCAPLAAESGIADGPAPDGGALWMTLCLSPRGGGTFAWTDQPPSAFKEGMAIPIPARPTGKVPGNVDAEDLVTIFDLIRSLGRSGSPATVLPVVIALVQSIRGLVGSASSDASRRLLALASRTAEYTGWMAQEAGDDRAALRWTDYAVELAEATGDLSLRDYAPVRRALVYLYRGDAVRTITLAGAVRDDQSVRLQTRVIAARREAQGYALAGDARRCLETLGFATELADQVGTAPDADVSAGAGIDGLGPTESGMADLVAGWCWYDLGCLAKADECLARGLRSLPEAACRARARFTARQALAQAACQDLDRACQAMSLALTDISSVDSATIQADVRAFSRTVRRWQTYPAVRVLEPELAAVLLRGELSS